MLGKVIKAKRQAEAKLVVAIADAILVQMLHRVKAALLSYNVWNLWLGHTYIQPTPFNVDKKYLIILFPIILLKINIKRTMFISLLLWCENYDINVTISYSRSNNPICQTEFYLHLNLQRSIRRRKRSIRWTRVEENEAVWSSY